MMDKTPQTELVETIHAALRPTMPGLALGPLGSGPGVAMQMTGGSGTDVYLGREENRFLTLLFLCKDKSQMTAYDTVCRIGNTLRALYPLPQPTRARWIKNVIETDPQEVGIANNMHVYSCVIHAHYSL